MWEKKKISKIEDSGIESIQSVEEKGAKKETKKYIE